MNKKKKYAPAMESRQNHNELKIGASLLHCKSTAEKLHHLQTSQWGQYITDPFSINQKDKW
jgi:hypothetical protein